MAKYKVAEVERAEAEGFVPFSAKFHWDQSSDAVASTNFSLIGVFIGDEHDEDNHTGIDKTTLQAYHLQTPSGDDARMVVMIGLMNIKKKKHRHGLETFCKRLIFDTSITAQVGQPIERSDLEAPHGPDHDPDRNEV
jgi:hypothetical protein